MARKNIMVEFEIDEISGVDTPAQVGARAVLMKRNDNPNDDSGTMDYEDLEKRGMTPNDDESRDAFMQRFMNDEGMRERFPDKGARQKMADKTFQEKRRAKKSNADGSSEGGNIGQATDGDDPMTKQTDKPADDKSTARIAELEKSLAETKLIAALNDAEKAHLGTLEGDDRTAFLGKSADERGAILKNAEAENPVVATVDGVDYHKNDDPRLLEMAKRQAATEKALRLAEDQRVNDQLEKRAANELGNLTGETLTKRELLRAVDSIADEATRKGALALLKSANDTPALAQAFEPIGAINAPNADPVTKGDATTQLEELAKRHAEANKVDIVTARVAVLDTPEGDALYRQTL